MKANQGLAILLVVVIAIASLAGCTEKKNMVPAEYKGLKFSVPESWEENEIEYGDFLAYQFAYDDGTEGYCTIRVEDFTDIRALKEFSSWDSDAAKIALDRNIEGYIQYFVGYEAVSTEEMRIGGQPALVHRSTATRVDESTSYREFYVTGISTKCVAFDTSFFNDAGQAVADERKADMDAFLKSIDLSGLD